MSELNVDVAVNSSVVSIEIRPKPEPYNYFSVPTETKEQVDTAPEVKSEGYVNGVTLDVDKPKRKRKRKR